MESELINIILCGGSGTRLWPISRTLMPKQFVKLFDNKSLFQLTIERNSKVSDSRFIILNTEQYFLAVNQLEELKTQNSKPKTSYLLEPAGRNTAPAIALACMTLNSDETVFVVPSDHLIKNEIEYKKVVEQAEEFARQNYLVVFGITPTYPETGYGYIEAKKFDVIKFHEKPNVKTAMKYAGIGNRAGIANQYFWNSGMFMFKAGVYLDELKKYSPKIYKSSKIALDNSLKIKNLIFKINESDMFAIPEDSIDYAVMEKSDKVKVVPSDIGWSDLGNFDSLCKELPKDNKNNTILTTNSRYSDTPITINSKNNLIISEKKIALIDIEDCIIVDTGDALLISKKGSSQKVKKIVQKLNTQHSTLATTHATVHRPWGAYTVLEDSIGYKIKRIEVKPGKRLSLQKHCYRNEHWIVISGTATVTVEDKTYLVKPNESTYIKMGEVHRLANEEKMPVVLIEAQVGQYTGEDDIVRIEDDYDR